MRNVGLKWWIIGMLFIVTGCAAFLITWNIYFFVLGLAVFVVIILVRIIDVNNAKK